MELKNKFEEHTESELLDFLKKIWAIDAASESEHDALVEHFAKISEHPKGNRLIFYPDADAEDNLKGVLEVVKAWRAANGKPNLKSE